MTKLKLESKPSLRRKLLLSLGSLTMILIVSGVISIIEYRRMSNYVSGLIASDIKCINVSRKLADITEEYNHRMIAVVVQNDISLMPDFNLKYFNAHADSLRNSFVSQTALSWVDTVSASFNSFIRASMKFDEVFLADSVDTGEWFFGTLQPAYNKFRQDMGVLNDMVYDELKNNSADLDAGFYRSIIPGVVSVGAGVLLVILLFYFTLVNYVNPIYRISDGIDNYRNHSRRYGCSFEGDDQLSNINAGVTEIIEENIELRRRVSSLREDRERL